MKIHEYQGKEIFRRFGIPVPDGVVATTAEQAEQAAHKLGGRVVVKAQIHAGGRGKGTRKDAPEVRGVKVASDPKAAAAHAEALLGHPLVTHQTGAAGQIVRRVLVERASDIAQELYVGMVLDRD
ncbi:MAG: acetate--CoA ligase family protein, partial [Deltaproteobacteria bacterium]|nr:acetate--CoA ligase family protein [Deltaproteobacteria bacterium]